MDKYESLLAAEGIDIEAAKYLTSGQKKLIDDYLEGKERLEKLTADHEHRKLIKDGVRLLIEKNYPINSFKEDFRPLYNNFVSLIANSMHNRSEFEIENGNLKVKGKVNEQPKTQLEKMLHAAKVRLSDDETIEDVMKAAFRETGGYLLQGAVKKKVISSGLTMAEARRIMRGKKDDGCQGSCTIKL